MTCCPSSGGFEQPDASGEVSANGNDYVPLPVNAARGQAGATIFDDFRGGMFYAPHGIEASRLIFRISNFAGAADMVCAVYQPDDGESGVSSLLNQETVTLGAIGTLDIPFPVIIAPGIYFMLFGIVPGGAANNQCTTYGAAANFVLNFPYSSIPNGLQPTDLETTVNPPGPATLDLRVGAGVSIESGGPICLIHRWAN